VASITFENVGKRFPDGTDAVVDVNLHVEEGEFLVLVGPSGSGKTTALRIVAGLEDATAGRVLIGDRVVNDVEPRDRDLAMVFQSYALYPHMTVGQNMGFALRMQHVSKAEIRVRTRDAAELLGIADLLGRRPRQLSGGQRQRVALGRAIVRQPQAFLMDEPLSNLDAMLRVEMRAYLARLHEELRTTTVYVTHDQVEAMTMGDRVAVMRDGRVVQVDAPEALYARPADVFVASFMGSPAMNLVVGRIDDCEPLELELGAARLPLPDAVLVERPALRSYAGQEVVVGIRPETIAVSDNGRPPTLERPVLMTERLGSDILAHLDLDAPAPGRRGEGAGGPLGLDPGHSIIKARLAPTAVAVPGRALPLILDPTHLHFFDRATGRAIGREPSGRSG
jgi:multiple sugar transport system ATP-binding protein